MSRTVIYLEKKIKGTTLAARMLTFDVNILNIISESLCSFAKLLALGFPKTFLKEDPQMSAEIMKRNISSFL